MELKDEIVKAIRKAETELPTDAVKALESALNSTGDNMARSQLEAILKNVRLAKEKGVPICQDTGSVTFYTEIGDRFPLLPELHSAILGALPEATDSVPIRPNAVDPFTGKNTGNNLGRGLPLIDTMIVQGDRAVVHILPKGGGSENGNTVLMLTPSEGIEGMKKKVLEHIHSLGGRTCPPVIVGIGIGGSSDHALRMAKRSLLRALGTENPDGKAGTLEKELLEKINKLGIGPMGLGGAPTALEVHVEYAARHPASFPVGVAIQCWADRRVSLDIGPDGTVEMKQ